VTTDQQLLEEVRALRAQLTHPHSLGMRHGWLKLVIHDLEYNPRTQYKVHIAASYFWIITAAPILLLFFGFPEQWLQWGVLITLLYSLYANFATDYGAASAALAAMGNDPLPEVPTEPFIACDSSHGLSEQVH
jgi:hypothetical protein